MPQSKHGFGVGPSEAGEGYNAFFKGKKAVIEGVYGKSKATLYSL